MDAASLRKKFPEFTIHNFSVLPLLSAEGSCCQKSEVERVRRVKEGPKATTDTVRYAVSKMWGLPKASGHFHEVECRSLIAVRSSGKRTTITP